MKDTENKIYVVIPCYNCKSYLRTALDSVLRQCNGSFEIILIDDGSTDGTSQLCDKVAGETNNIIVIHKENGGVASARNKGLEYIYTKKSFNDSYIAFLDADDAWVKDAINGDVIELLNQNYDCICLQSLYCNGDLTRFANPTYLKEGESAGGENSVWKNRGQHFGAVLFSAAFLFSNNIRFLPMKYSEDKIFLMQSFCLAKTICFKNIRFYLYRNNKYSAIHSRNYGIKYFDPIVRGYIQMDHLCNQTLKSNKPVVVGHECARTYLIDMIKEHYQYGGTQKELDAYFEKNPDLWQLLNDKSVGGFPMNNKYKQLNTIKKSIPYYRKAALKIYLKIKKPLLFIYSSLFNDNQYPNKLYEDR